MYDSFIKHVGYITLNPNKKEHTSQSGENLQIKATIKLSSRIGNAFRRCENFTYIQGIIVRPVLDACSQYVRRRPRRIAPFFRGG